ncbi:MAG: acylphosphatase [Gracilimonas sp.]|uniref:acylphosphatase n=1 Tax=Gracilimonas TaxID=649462 RepID=UPI001B1E4EF3|nr:acylphosphatase [Gracilimonas sp.]MBO6585964.1 acylphosphatase [Gracilimonas sp.]MBO6616961.1 acylphosphatase [Gracilimonas sp.]
MKKHIFLSGRVQGVGFRHFTKTKARSIGVKGWVRNLPDGRVEAVFEGDEKLVDQLIEKCKKGPRSAYVQSIDVEEEKSDESYTSFDVKF